MWFTEDAWSPIIVCVLLGALFFAAALIWQRPKLLWAVVLCAVSSVAIFFVEQAIVTDTEKVEATLTDLIETFVRESQQSPKLPEPQCTRFFSARNDRDKARISGALALVRVTDVRITDVHTRLTNQNTRAITHFRANGTIHVGSDGGHFPTRWELSWQKEAGEWKVILTRMLNSVSGDEIGTPRVDR